MYTGRMLNKEDISVRISLSTLFWAAGIILGAYFLYRIQAIVITVLFSVIVMAALRPSVRFMERRLKFPKILAILVLYALFILLITVAFAVILPPLFRELPNFIHALALPPSLASLYQLSAGNWNALNLSLTDLSSLIPQIGVSFTAVYTIVSSTFTGILTFVTVLVGRRHRYKPLNLYKLASNRQK